MSDPDTDLGVRSVSMSYSMAHLGYIDSVWMYSSSLRNYLPRPGGAGKFQLLTLGVHFTLHSGVGFPNTIHKKTLHLSG